MSALLARVKRLETMRVIGMDPDDCPRPETSILIRPGEAVPDDLPRCSVCGGVHVLEIVEETVGPALPGTESP